MEGVEVGRGAKRRAWGGHGLRLVGVEAGGDFWTEGNEENEVEWLIGVWLSGKGDGWGG